MKKIPTILLIVLFFVSIIGFFAYNSLFSAPQKQAELERFIIPINTSKTDIIKKLNDQGFIKSESGFKFVFTFSDIEAGAYKISKNMSAWEVGSIMKQKPYMVWITIPEGLRKEQIGEILADSLGWTEQEKKDWITKYTAKEKLYTEGVYFPDTYLLSTEESPSKIAERFIDKFNEKFQPYTERFIKENIKWNTALRIASIIQREASGNNDMPLISGILWNRLLKNMRLEVDATVQYARDDIAHYGVVRNNSQPQTYMSEGDWWKPMRSNDKNIDSPYNTYRNSGLPPHPICNPGLDAIDAVLNPTKTDCLYYIHDTNGQIYCSKTYEEHKNNIEKFL
jgi:UPF0755 protein